MKFLLSTLLTLTFTAELRSQIRLDNAKYVTTSDAIYPTLAEYRGRIQRRYAADGNIIPTFSQWIDVQSAVATKLFPSLHFAAISWDENANPQAKTKLAGLAHGLQITIGVEKDAKGIQCELFGSGNYEPFGELLARNQVRIRDAADANTVWEAFCDLHFKHWKEQAAIKQSDSLWHLGDVTINRFHYYYQVNLDDRQVVKSAQLRADEIQKP